MSKAVTRDDLDGLLVGIHELKAMIEAQLGKEVSKQYIDKITRYPDFPEAALRLGIGRMWFADEAKDFVGNKLENRPKGRPRKAVA